MSSREAKLGGGTLLAHHTQGWIDGVQSGRLELAKHNAVYQPGLKHNGSTSLLYLMVEFATVLF